MNSLILYLLPWFIAHAPLDEGCQNRALSYFLRPDMPFGQAMRIMDRGKGIHWAASDGQDWAMLGYCGVSVTIDKNANGDRVVVNVSR